MSARHADPSSRGPVTRRAPLPPRTTTPHPIGPESSGPEVLAGFDDLDGVELAELAVDAVDLGGGRALRDCLVHSCRALEVEAASVEVDGCLVTGCDLPVVEAPRSRARRTEIRDTRLGSVVAHDALWRGVRLVRCRVGYLDLRAADLRDVLLEDCQVDELDLTGARAERLAMPGSVLGRVDVNAAVLRDVDLRGATLARVDGVTGLRGATLGDEQAAALAPVLAAELGIRVLGG